MRLSKEFYTIDEVATILDCHVDTLRRAIREGRIPVKRISEKKRHGFIRIPANWIRETTGGGNAT